jgi:tricorn protease-like protein
MTKPAPQPGHIPGSDYIWTYKGTRCSVADADEYGYWERIDGSEGGGLWFSRDDDGVLKLIDYDGGFSLPSAVVRELRAAGFSISEHFAL